MTDCFHERWTETHSRVKITFLTKFFLNAEKSEDHESEKSRRKSELAKKKKSEEPFLPGRQ